MAENKKVSDAPELPEGQYQIFPADKPIIRAMGQALEEWFKQYARDNGFTLHNRFVVGAVEYVVTNMDNRSKMIAFKKTEKDRQDLHKAIEKFNNISAKTLAEAEDFYKSFEAMVYLGIEDKLPKIFVDELPPHEASPQPTDMKSVEDSAKSEPFGEKQPDGSIAFDPNALK